MSILCFTIPSHSIQINTRPFNAIPHTSIPVFNLCLLQHICLSSLINLYLYVSLSLYSILLSCQMVTGLHSHSAFLTSGLSKQFTMLRHVRVFMHAFTLRRPCQPGTATASWSGAVGVRRRVAQGHLDARPGGAGDRTSNLRVTSQLALPPDPHAAHVKTNVSLQRNAS